ncbi:MAG: hypothetical protein ORO03_00980, partial [Alphaproteobacteria bacterium]|nr:hypothetical protein [Alphaproteobacteria bacterium]
VINRLSSSILVLTLILSPLSIINTAAAVATDPTITLNGPASVNVGDTFNVPIVFSNFTSLSGGQFRIAFDNTKVNLVANASGRVLGSTYAIANSTFYDSGSQSAITLSPTFIKDNSPAVNTVSATATEISILTGTFSDGNGANFTNQDGTLYVSNGTFITLKFKAIASGNPNIRFEEGQVAGGTNFANTIGTPTGNLSVFNLVGATTQVAVSAPVASVAPTISTNPSNTTATVGQTSSLPSFSVTASSTAGTLSYQ